MAHGEPFSAGAAELKGKLLDATVYSNRTQISFAISHSNPGHIPLSTLQVFMG